MEALSQAYSGIQQYAAAAALPNLYNQSLLSQQSISAAGSQKEGQWSSTELAKPTMSLKGVAARCNGRRGKPASLVWLQLSAAESCSQCVVSCFNSAAPASDGRSTGKIHLL